MSLFLLAFFLSRKRCPFSCLLSCLPSFSAGKDVPFSCLLFLHAFFLNRKRCPFSCFLSLSTGEDALFLAYFLACLLTCLLSQWEWMPLVLLAFLACILAQQEKMPIFLLAFLACFLAQQEEMPSPLLSHVLRILPLLFHTALAVCLLPRARTSYLSSLSDW